MKHTVDIFHLSILLKSIPLGCYLLPNEFLKNIKEYLRNVFKQGKWVRARTDIKKTRSVLCKCMRRWINQSYNLLYLLY